jgi:hypothetical protein
MNRQMRFGEVHRAGDTLRLELVETLADRRVAGVCDGAQAQCAQRAGVEHFGFCRRATIPLAQQMDSVHRPLPDSVPAPLFMHRACGTRL